MYSQLPGYVTTKTTNMIGWLLVLALIGAAAFVVCGTHQIHSRLLHAIRRYQRQPSTTRLTTWMMSYGTYKMLLPLRRTLPRLCENHRIGSVALCRIAMTIESPCAACTWPTLPKTPQPPA